MNTLLTVVTIALIVIFTSVSYPRISHTCDDITYHQLVTSYVNCTYRSKFSSVAVAYNNLFVDGTDVGSGFSLYWKGCKAVDCFGGNSTDAGTPWQYNTLVNTFSVGKQLHDVAIGLLNYMGVMYYQDVIADQWLEFGQKGKENITYELAFSMRAGLIGYDAMFLGVNTLNHTFMDEVVANTTPTFPPTGSYAAYSAQSIGHLVDAIVRRRDPMHRGLERFLKDNFMGVPGLEEVEFYYTPSAEDPSVNARIAQLTNTTFRIILNDLVTKMCSLPETPYPQLCRAILNPIDVNYDVFSTNNMTKRNFFDPAGFTWTTPRTIASIYGVLVNPSTRKYLISDEAFNKMIEIVYQGIDYSDGTANVTYTKAGFSTPTSEATFSPTPSAFHRNGLPGSEGFGDPVYNLGFGYLTRNCRHDSNNYMLLSAATYACFPNGPDS